MKLLEVKKSTRKDKKYMAVFDDGTSTNFGSAGMDDYTITKDKEQRERYRTRHKKDLETKDPTRAGYLSYYLLWNKPTLKDSIAYYKKRFNL